MCRPYCLVSEINYPIHLASLLQIINILNSYLILHTIVNLVRQGVMYITLSLLHLKFMLRTYLFPTSCNCSNESNLSNRANFMDFLTIFFLFPVPNGFVLVDSIVSPILGLDSVQ